VDDFTYAMKVCTGHPNLPICLHENLKDYPKCFPKVPERTEEQVLPEN
jgi:hypothetical protein